MKKLHLKPKYESPQQILEYYKGVYPKLKDVSIKNISDELVQKYHGYALFKLDEKWEMKGKNRHSQVHPYGILLNRKLEKNVYVLLHEISHCLAPHVERRVRGKGGQKWVYMEHEREFYVQLMEIIKIGNKAGIFEKEFRSIDELVKFDKSV